MSSNFSFLEKNSQFNSFSFACIEAEKSIVISPSTTAILSRRALELAVRWVYSFDSYLKVPYQENLSSLIHDRNFKDILDEKLFPMLKYIKDLGNHAVHTNSSITREEAILSLHHLHEFVSWINYCYSDQYFETSFDEALVSKGEEKRVKPEELKELYDRISAKDRNLEDIIKENEDLRKQLRSKREKNTKDYTFNVDEISEFETRKRYIDLDLKAAGWVFNRDIVEELDVQGMPNTSGIGFVDYVLFGDNGKPLAVVEAKRTSKDPRVGEQQAKLYADLVERKYGQRPIIYYSNGFELFMWDDLNYVPRKVSGFYTKDELNLLIERRNIQKPLRIFNINEDITNRPYQREAILSVCDAFEKKDRKALLVMATGSGKTRTAISIVDVLTRHNWAKNILFLADRTALVSQAKKNFSKLLPNLSLCNLLDRKDNPESRMVFSTYPTMMNAIDDTKTKEGKKLFTVGHFDLIIIDESHRSIYKKYQAIFDYFDGLLLGLTATPKDDIDKNTYSVFDLENNVPTYAYELKDAIADEYLVDYRTVETKMKFLDEGIKYDELSDEDKEIYEDTFLDDYGEEISSEALNKWLFNNNTIDQILAQVMEKGIKVEGGDKLGKTIIFAKSHKHAVMIVERFNILYPEYRGEFARVIDNQVNYAQSLIDNLSEKDKMPQIAISVDMLDTGIDIPEIVNLVFFKKVRSKSKFWQMIGRGTRLCENLFGEGEHKRYFIIFDYLGNFDFFRVNPNGIDAKQTETLTEKILNTKIELIKELQHSNYQTDNYIDYRNALINDIASKIQALDNDNFRTKQKLKYVHRYRDIAAWNNLGVLAVKELKDHIAPLLLPDDEDELAKRFDNLMLSIELSLLTGSNSKKLVNKVLSTAEALSKIGTIPQITAQKKVINKVQTEEFWVNIDIFELEVVREALRDLIKFIEKEHTQIYYTNFSDEIIDTKEGKAEYYSEDFYSYRKKVNSYLNEHKDELVIYKLRNNKELTTQDIKNLENILWEELGSREDYTREYGDMPLTKLVLQIVGLDQKAANDAFAEFLNDESLNLQQVKFVRLIINYVIKNGTIEKTALQEDPFKSVGSIVELFSNDMDKARKIITVIDAINKNATEVTGA